jgi:hypothetical protein
MLQAHSLLPVERTAHNLRRHTNALLREIKAEQSDFEWYPTTEAMLQVIKDDLLKDCGSFCHDTKQDVVRESLLDCGAGDGRALMFLTQGSRYAIEKARPLVEAMDKDIFVIGADFHENTLLDKKINCIFSNPPYSEYESWACKIITEGQSAVAYLIIPQRWKDSEAITQALALRKFEAKVLESFDFLTADRQARAKVDIVKVDMGYRSRYGSNSSSNDAFDIWFDTHFKIEAAKDSVSDYKQKQQMEESLETDMASKGEIVKREGLVRLLDKLYQRDLAKLMDTYESMSKISPELLSELKIDLRSVKESLRMKIGTLKDIYWRKLFDSLTQITDKLCTDTREKLLKKLTASTHVDFNEANAVNIVIWVLKQSNIYYEEQIISTYETLTELANIQLYKSNQRTVAQDGWRYGRVKYSSLGPYGLDYRVVLIGAGGYDGEDSYSSRCPLASRATALINDLVTIANNLGFDAIGNLPAHEKTWHAGKPNHFWFQDAKTDEKQVLFEAKAFKKGTLHIRMNEMFIQKLNVVHGRLKGWLRSAAEATEEMDVSFEVAEEAFAVQLKLGASDVKLLRHSA